MPLSRSASPAKNPEREASILSNDVESSIF
jgi:hypothetical protein